MRRLVTIGALVIGLVLSSCSGEDEDTTTNPAPSGGAEAPSEGAAPPTDPSALPPEFVKCMAEQGFEVKSSADIHSAPQQVLQACFGSIH
ncbi:MAG: hypothetical protein H0T69_13790 [Thermoleophilaceae bacterium]|nr:hypothetical protein [Thermoleophilaceae bacterium]